MITTRKWLGLGVATTLGLLWASGDCFAQRPAPAGPIPTGGFRGPTMPPRPQNPPLPPRAPGDGLILPNTNNIDLILQNPNGPSLLGGQTTGQAAGIGGQQAGGTIGGTVGGNRQVGGGGGFGGGNSFGRISSGPRLGLGAKQYGFGGANLFVPGPSPLSSGYSLYGGKAPMRDPTK